MLKIAPEDYVNLGEITPSLKTALIEAREWLTWEQPEHALTMHHGIHYFGEKPARLGRVQLAQQHRPVLIFDTVFKPGFEQFIMTSTPTQYRFSKQDVTTLGTWLAEAGFEVIDTWNGENLATVSFRVKTEVSHHCLRLVANYQKGCPDHPHEKVFCRCGWFSKGYNLVRFPENWR